MKSGCETAFERSAVNKERLKPISSGEERCAPGHFWGAGVRGSYIIHYIISGTGVFYCGTNKHVLKKGQMFVIFPGTVVKYQADIKDPWHYAWVVFNGEEAKEVFGHMGVSPRSPIITVEDDKKTVDLIRRMPSERRGVLSEDLRFSALLYELMSVLTESASEDKSENAYINAATRYVRAHYPEELTVEQISSHVGISRKYLFAIFKNNLGISPKDYLMDYRIKKACELLEDKSLSIGNVAYSVGYTDQLTFSRMFKKRMGISPTEYKEKTWG